MYYYNNFIQDFEEIMITHPHTVRRESNKTYIDEFAFREVMEISPEIYKDTLEGWSRSYYTLDYHMKGIWSYSSPNVPASAINIPLYQQAMEAVRKELNSLPRVKAYDALSELDRVPFKSSSSAGYDYIGAKGDINGNNHRRAITRARATIGHIVEQGNEGMHNAITTAVPDVGYTRTQLTDLYKRAKVRGVWGRAFHYILLEGLTVHPLLEVFKQHETFYHIGQDPVESVPSLLSSVSRYSKWIYALDWKQFDASVSRFEINAAFDLIKELVDFPNSSTEAAFELSRQLFIHKKIAAPNGKTYWSHKGIPSGSYFTSVAGSIINKLRIEYLWRCITGHGPKLCYTQGDDSLVGDDDYVNPKQIGEIANQIGWFFNPDKTEYSTVPELITFLGRTYKGGMNVRDLKRCLRLLVYPEYPVESGRISAYRANSLAQDCGSLSELLNRVADRLKRHYGVASEEEVPLYFKRYIV